MTTVCLSFDFDAASLWIHNLKMFVPAAVSRGEYGARVGVGRILQVLGENDVQATFFVPGHTAELFPDAVRAIACHGHEIGAHGYLHEVSSSLSREQEIAVLERAEAALERVTKQRPQGFRAPAWDLSPATIELLEARGYVYDSSLMSDVFTPFRARKGDIVGEDGGIVWGRESNIIEFSVAWELDDFPYFAFISRHNSGLRNSNDVLDIWLQEFDFCAAQKGVFTLTMHPQVIGRGPRIRMLDRLIKSIKKKPAVRFMTMSAAAQGILIAGAPIGT
jgi:peptidoglycan/xylan/chitin deacetylase (PgdA/CDA1 family)